MSNNRNKQQRALPAQRFIINLFGESGAGKTFTLTRLIEMLRARARYNLEEAEGFKTRDRRSIMWYRVGQKYSGAVCVCTMGDAVEIIQKNLDFFETHFNNGQIITPWTLCEKKLEQKLTEDELRNATRKGDLIGVLITASRKPLGDYKKLQDRIKDYVILNIPIRVDVWYKHKGKDKASFCDWMLSICAIPEQLLFHLNYVLRNGKFKKYMSKNGYRVDFSALSSSISRG